MQFQIKRVILFMSDMASMARFYGDVIGLKLLTDGEDWKEFSRRRLQGCAPSRDICAHRPVSEDRVLCV
jgi:hypothetical protein